MKVVKIIIDLSITVLVKTRVYSWPSCKPSISCPISLALSKFAANFAALIRTIKKEIMIALKENRMKKRARPHESLLRVKCIPNLQWEDRQPQAVSVLPPNNLVLRLSGSEAF